MKLQKTDSINQFRDLIYSGAQHLVLAWEAAAAAVRDKTKGVYQGLLDSQTQVMSELLKRLEEHNKTHYSGGLRALREHVNHLINGASNTIHNTAQFRDEVVIYLRALQINLDSTLSGCTHREKDARLGGAVQLIETAIHRLTEETFQWAGFSNVRCYFRSETPHRRYLDRIRDLEADLKRLQESATPNATAEPEDDVPL